MKEPRKMFNLFKERSKEHTFMWNKGKLKRIGNGDKTGFSLGWRESIVHQQLPTVYTDLTNEQ